MQGQEREQGENKYKVGNEDRTETEQRTKHVPIKGQEWGLGWGRSLDKHETKVGRKKRARNGRTGTKNDMLRTMRR